MKATAGSSNLEDVNKLREQLQWIDVNEEELQPNRFERFKRRMLRNPLVPIGCISTITVLFFGLRSLIKGNAKKSQHLMRWRVGLQGSTIAVFIAGLYLDDYLQNREKL